MKTSKDQSTVSVIRTDALLSFPTKRKAKAYFKRQTLNGVKGGMWIMIEGKVEVLS